MTKEAQTPGVGTPIKDVTKAMESICGRSSLLEDGRAAGVSGVGRPCNLWLQGWKEKLQASHRETMGGGKKDQERKEKLEGSVPPSEP